MIRIKLLCTIFTVLTLVGCGGGGGGSTTPTPTPTPPATNNTPIASAGEDQTVVVGEMVNLSGATSSDADGDNLSYLWVFSSLPDGSSAILSHPASVSNSFVADMAGSYVVTLTVNDGQVTSTADTITITANPPPNNAPVADAGADKEAFTGETVNLSGSASQDPDGDALTYNWQIESRPDSSNAALTNPDSESTSFVADVEGTYSLSLTVNDGQIDSSADTVTVTVVDPNTAPVANAGEDSTTIVGNTVSLSGAGSSDADDDTLTYTWQFDSRPDGSNTTLSDPASEAPTFVADLPGSYQLSLVVNDGELSSAADSVTITAVIPNSAPVANAGSDNNASTGDTVSLSGAASSDADGDELAYAWHFDSRPNGSNATLSGDTSVSPSFVADVAGNFIISLTVNDGQANSTSDLVTITVTDPNNTPIANAGADNTATVGDTVSLSGADSSDADGDNLTYSWQFDTLPEGSSATVTNAATVSPSFDADTTGDFVISLVVNDGKVDSAADTVTITVSAANSVPTANAGEDIEATVGNTVNLTGAASSDADDDELTYAWTFDNRPAGSTATLSDSTSVTPTFIPDVEGSYVLSLVVNDGKLSSTADTITVTVTEATSAPVANAGVDDTAVEGDTVTLSGAASTDGGTDTLTYAWSFQTKPSDSSATLTNATSVSPSFIADVPGNFIVSLIVNNGEADSEADTVTITVTAANKQPTANAGEDDSSVVGRTVNLSGADSSDPEDDTLTYSWQFDTRPEGSSTSLSDATSVTPSFVADAAGEFVLSLTVNDGELTSEPDSVTITVINANTVPVANAGEDSSAKVGDTVTLSGSNSSDSDGDTLTYLWQFSSRPDTSNATITESNTISPSFVPDIDGSYVVSLTVNDGQADSEADTVTITVSKANTAPVANAGEDIAGTNGETVTLNGNASSDEDGDALTYLWQLDSQPADSTTRLRNETTETPSFLPDVAGSYIASLTVNDGQLDSAADTVTITVAQAKPVANAGTDTSVLLGETVTLSGSDSSDIDGDTLSYNWTFDTKPDTSSASLSNSTTVSPSFVADVAGSYVVSLVVNDGTVDSDADTVTITALNSSGAFTEGEATTTVTNLFSSGSRVAAIGTITDNSNRSLVATTWTVPADVRFTDDTMPTASDLHNVYVSGHDYSSADLALAGLDGSDVIEIDSTGEIITAYVFADNYFEMYINGTAVGKDPVPFTDFNSSIIRFKVSQPFTVAMLLVDWEENLGTGTEDNSGSSFHPGDGGMVAVFKDSNGDIIGVSDNSWKAQTYYTAPITDSSCLSESDNQRLSTSCSTSAPESLDNVMGVHWARPDDWTSKNFDDSNWPSAVTFSNDTVGVDNKASYTNFTDVFDDSNSDAQFIWSSNLVLDNEILVRASIGTSSFTLASKALKTDLILPFSATCDGKNNGSMIPLSWSGAPSDTASYALVMLNYPNPDDAPDVSKAHGYTVLYDIPASTTSLDDGQTSVGTFGINSIDGEQAFSAPCSKDAISNDYTINLYALSNEVNTLGLEASSTDLSALSTAISSTTLGTATLSLSKVRYNPNNDDHVPTSVPSDCETKSAAFTAYSDLVTVSCDSTTMTVTTKTMLPYRSNLDSDKPDVGIKSWIGRVAIPEETSWSFPLQPTYLSSTESNVNIHDAIGVSVEGVPILHYAKETSNGEIAQIGTDYSDRDTVLLGEIDQCGAHAGNGEDYHYHTAPICLMDTHDPSQPLAYMFDGIPLYFGTGGGVLTTDGTDYGAGRYDELDYRPQNVKTGERPLDDCNAYDVNGDGSEYVYYSSAAAPYTIACYRAEADQSSSVSPGPHWTEERDLAWSGSDVELTDHDTMIFENNTWTFTEITPGDNNNNIPSGKKALIMYRQLVEGDDGYDADQNCYTFRYRLDSTVTDGSDDTVSTHCR